MRSHNNSLRTERLQLYQDSYTGGQTILKMYWNRWTSIILCSLLALRPDRKTYWKAWPLTTCSHSVIAGSVQAFFSGPHIQSATHVVYFTIYLVHLYHYAAVSASWWYDEDAYQWHYWLSKWIQLSNCLRIVHRHQLSGYGSRSIPFTRVWSEGICLQHNSKSQCSLFHPRTRRFNQTTVV